MNLKISTTFFGQAKAYIVAHKAVSIVIAVAVVGGGYGIWHKAFTGPAQTKYILATATKRTLSSTVSGSGQVAAVNQVDIKSAVSGTINRIDVSAGDTVRAGQAIAEIDSSDAVRAVANAQLALENAQVSYDKAVKDAGVQAATSTSSDIAKAYQTGYNAIVAAAVDLPAMFSGMTDIYYTPSHSPYFSDLNITTQVDASAAAYKLQAGAAFDAAKAEYQSNFQRYKDINIDSSPAEIVALLDETDVILRKLLSSVSGTYSTIDYIQNKLAKVPSELTTDKTSLSGYVAKINSDDSSIANALSGIDDAQSSQTTADLNVKSAELAVNQDAAALQDAQKALADHVVKAPFDGIIAKVASKPTDIAADGTTIATIVTQNDLVDISLNEIDAAKVSKGDAAALTFDAIDGLTLPGHVSNVDLVGTVSQGVVTYTVEITFDSVDPRVKPGMTTNADITTDVKQDALVVPSSAIKTQRGSSYVEVLGQTYSRAQAAQGVTSATPPSDKPVTVGISNDTVTEVTSGLSEGDQVIVRTVAGATASASAAPSILNSIGGSRAAGAGAASRNVQFIRTGAGG